MLGFLERHVVRLPLSRTYRSRFMGLLNYSNLNYTNCMHRVGASLMRTRMGTKAGIATRLKLELCVIEKRFGVESERAMPS